MIVTPYSGKAIRSPWSTKLAAPTELTVQPPMASTVELNSAAPPTTPSWLPLSKRITLGVLAGISLLGAAGCSHTPESANVVTVHMGPAASFRKAHDMVTRARQRIKLEMYELQRQDVDGDRGASRADGFKEQQQLSQDLVDMAGKGRNVEVILDESERKSGTNNSEMKSYLESHGVHVEVYPVNTVALDHVKMLVVDGEEVLIGGVNWSSLFPKHHDADISIKGPAAKDAETLFDNDWDFAGGKTKGLRALPSGTDEIRFTTTAPCSEDGGSSGIRNQLLDVIPRTHERFYVEMFTLNDRDTMDALIKLKAKGKDVRIILDKTEKTNKESFDYLKANGVPVRWFHKVTKEEAKRRPELTGLEGGWLHAKWAEQDKSYVQIGSANWTDQALNSCGFPTKRGPRDSADHNHEIDVGVRNGAAATQFDKQFLYDWENATEH